MKRFEYLREDGFGISVSQLDAFGYEGWELVTVILNASSLTYIFKRELPDTSK